LEFRPEYSVCIAPPLFPDTLFENPDYRGLDVIR
jgi:hypothetical protein